MAAIDPSDAVLAAGELQATSDQLDLLGAWFPLRNATMYWADRF